MSKIASRNPKVAAERSLPEIRFRLIGDQLLDIVTGLPAYTTGNHFIMIDPLPDPGERLRTALYFNQDGTPADKTVEYWLLRDASHFLTAWHGHFYREPPPPGAEGIDFTGDLQVAMEQFDRVFPVNDGSTGARSWSRETLEQIPDLRLPEERWDEYLASRATAGPRRTRRPLLNLPQSAWRQLVVRRLALIFGRSARDVLLRELAEYFCGDGGWIDWVVDDRFASFASRAEKEPRIAGVLNVLHHFAVIRSQQRDYNYRAGARRSTTLPTRRGKYVFDFPPGNRKGKRAEQATRLLLLVSYVDLHQKALKANFPKLCAAVVYEAREYLVAPKSLRAGEMTQAQVAGSFGITRRQLQAGLREIRQPDYADRVFGLAFARKQRRH